NTRSAPSRTPAQPAPAPAAASPAARSSEKRIMQGAQGQPTIPVTVYLILIQREVSRRELSKLSPELASPEFAAGVAGRAAELLLDADQLVVFGEAVGARQRTRFDLAGVGGDGEIGDRGILGLARAVREHGAITGAQRGFDRLQRLRQGA